VTWVGAKRVLQWHLVNGRDLEQQTLDGRYAIWREDSGLEGLERWVATRVAGGTAFTISERSPSRLDAMLACEEHAQRELDMPR
jgi:hypothetical protein